MAVVSAPGTNRPGNALNVKARPRRSGLSAVTANRSTCRCARRVTTAPTATASRKRRVLSASPTAAAVAGQQRAKSRVAANAAVTT